MAHSFIKSCLNMLSILLTVITLAEVCICGSGRGRGFCSGVVSFVVFAFSFHLLNCLLHVLKQKSFRFVIDFHC